MSFCYLRHYKLKITVFDCGVVLHLKLGNPQGSTLYHTTLLASSLQGADPWFLDRLRVKDHVVLTCTQGTRDQ